MTEQLIKCFDLQGYGIGLASEKDPLQTSIHYKAPAKNDPQHETHISV